MIELMESRGLVIDDRERMRQILFDSNYYRLSGYFRAFQNDPAHGDNDFRSGTTAADFLEPYQLDVELRSLILRGTGLLELTVRSRFAYLISVDGGAYSYMDAESYEPATNRKGVELRSSLVSNIRKWLDLSSEVCIRHYRAAGEPVPIWAAVETMPFDTVSRMLGLHSDTKALRGVYRSLGVRTNLRSASEIIHAMVYLRNLCSHHSRLWHREMVIVSPVTKDMRRRFPDFAYEGKSVAQSLIALMYLVDEISGGDAYSSGVISFLNGHADYSAGLRHPLHWE
ncbi:Abi family protein [Bifidobacterium callitrichos]|nr:Abi family protein [Bifidobacterium callitrichos]